ncbi:MAG: hypothetical protein Q9188_006950 [Gyalolechia gomerana]
MSAFWDRENFRDSLACVDIITNSSNIPVLWMLKVPTAKKAGLYTFISISFISVIRAFARVGAFVIRINS